MEMMKRLREAVRWKGPELRRSHWILHHNNDTAHKALSVKQFLAQKSTTEMEPPPPTPLVWLRVTSGCFQK
jgi:hypothetical protein